MYAFWNDIGMLVSVVLYWFSDLYSDFVAPNCELCHIPTIAEVIAFTVELVGRMAENQIWSETEVEQGLYPTPRHSHAAVVYQDSMYVFGGYDGSYRNDFHEFNFCTQNWTLVRAVGRVPRARYRTVCVVHRNHMVLFGGHDGARHLNDVHLFNMTSRLWAPLETNGPPPIPRDSHVAVAHGSAVYIYGGSTGSAMVGVPYFINEKMNLSLMRWMALWMSLCI